MSEYDDEFIDSLAEFMLDFDVWRDEGRLSDLEKQHGPEVVEAAFHRMSSIADGPRYRLVLRSIGPNKQKTIAAIQLLTGLSTSEVSELVDKTPVAIKEGISGQEANQLIGILEDHEAGQFTWGR
jgi:ribosomal protein L7/L12